MFTKILIANRGAIACRIIRTLKAMDIQSVAIYSDSDRDSLHVQQADESYCLEGDLASSTYLNTDKVLAIAQKSGAEAIHPGYGFLSENTDFARRCANENIVFIGPTPDQIEQFGLKHTARELAHKNNVPLIPGTGLLIDLYSAIQSATSIGFPIMLKSTAGGGGIGMQVCNSEAELVEAFSSVKRLSQNNFGNDGIFIEKYISRSRHIEVQVVGDGKGHIVTLGERDCSLQRRNQKVIEETPAPNLDNTIRQNMISSAYRLAQSVNYQSTGTIEFIFDVDSHDFYFLEMNTRLQVEHGVTELVCGIDLVKWMIQVAANETTELKNYIHKPQGHAVQARLYAEDAGKNFQPSSGLLTKVTFPENCRCDTYIEAGLVVPAFYDPMLAKVIAFADNRQQAIALLNTGLRETQIEGIVTNTHYLRHILQTPAMEKGHFNTQFLNAFNYPSQGIDVISAGTQTTVQDYPGRIGFWNVGVPPSGPMDNLAFQLGNRLLGNEAKAAGLEITLTGPTLKFRCNSVIVLSGALMNASLSTPDQDIRTVPFWKPVLIPAGSTLELGKITGEGMRSYLCIAGGLNISDYLGSKSTFTLGKFGGHGGRALNVGDVLSIEALSEEQASQQIKEAKALHPSLIPTYQKNWSISVIYGPHGAPDFFTDEDIKTFFETQWEVHFNSSRTGVRLIGPKPEWARSDGGEAGLHPSNIHDNAYAIGAVDFTGDMPVILGPDGPSLGGFVCPVTIIKADLWKMGQLSPGDTIRFTPIECEEAEKREATQNQCIHSMEPINTLARPFLKKESPANTIPSKPILFESPASENQPEIKYRVSGEDNLLIEYGEQELDLRLRFRVHALMLFLQDKIDSGELSGIVDLTPGIRSLQVHFDNLILPRDHLLALLTQGQSELGDIHSMTVPTRTVYLPLSWDDPTTQVAIEKYMTTVNPEAPWCPSNIEFIRRINGLDSIQQVKDIVFDANYLVMGLGDVYLGAPVATPLDPRHRLVTTKYNPARTWTPENAVGIGGAYMCVYGMEGPGGYQFVGRTVQMWNRYKTTQEFTQPWLLRFFDQIKFYEVSAEELLTMRRDFPNGTYSLRIEESEFSLADYEEFLTTNNDSIESFRQQQRIAFAEEKQRWQEQGIRFDTIEEAVPEESDDIVLAENEVAIVSSVPGSLWKLNASIGQEVSEGDCLAIVESMKMEFPIVTDTKGTINKITAKEGQQLTPGQVMLTISIDKANP